MVPVSMSCVTMRRWGQSSDCRCCCSGPAACRWGGGAGPWASGEHLSSLVLLFLRVVFVPSSTSKCEPSSVLTCVLVTSVFPTLSTMPLRLWVRGSRRHRVSSPITWHEAAGRRLCRQQGLVQQTFAWEGP